MSLEQKQPPDIIDLVDSNEEDDPMPNADVQKRKESNDDDVWFVGVATPENPKPTKRLKESNAAEDDENREEEEEDRKPAAVVKKEPVVRNGSGLPEISDEDIQLVNGINDVIPEDPPKVPPYASMNDISQQGQDDDEIAVVGTRNRLRLPHMRQHCTEHPFGIANAKVLPQFVTRLQQNTAHCDLCYCYVCDDLVKSCQKWADHCYATDTGREAPHFKRLRRDMRIERDRLKAITEPIIAGMTPIENEEEENGHENHGDFHRLIGSNCMHCKMELIPYWGGKTCKICGRTTASCHYAPSQDPIEEKKDMLRLGKREFSFRMVTPDLRKLSPYDQHWTANEGQPGWEIDHAAEATDVFRRKLGKRPTLCCVLDCLSPCRDEQSIPTEAPESEKSAIFLDDPKGGSLLLSLNLLNNYFGNGTHLKDKVCEGSVSVSFNAEARRGVSCRIDCAPR